jgi:hypothetical protein
LRGAVVCTIAGLRDDMPVLCRDRCLQVKLRERLESVQIGKLPIPRKIWWPDQRGIKLESSLANLTQQVKSAMRATNATPVEIRRAFNNGPAPWVFFSPIERETFDTAHRDLLFAWVKFWREVGMEPLNKPLVVFLLMHLDGSSPPDFSLERFFLDDLSSEPPDGAAALDLLSDFSRDDVGDWLRIKASELGVSDEDVEERVLPVLWNKFRNNEPLRLATLEKWVLDLRI